jgi:hypothetical protein
MRVATSAAKPKKEKPDSSEIPGAYAEVGVRIFDGIDGQIRASSETRLVEVQRHCSSDNSGMRTGRSFP